MEQAIHDNDSLMEYPFLDDIKALLIIKSCDWEYEKEWRIIATKLEMQNVKRFENRNLSFDCVTGIYLGLRINKEILQHVKEIVKRINCTRKERNKPFVRLYESKLHSKEFKLVYSEIKLCKDEL